MWLIKLIVAGLIFILFSSITCYGYENMIFHLMSDITIKCLSSSTERPRFTNRSNIREFFYQGFFYILISDLSPENKGFYNCVSNNVVVSATRLEIKEQLLAQEMVKFRTVGDNLRLLCRPSTDTTSAKWKWTSVDSSETALLEISNTIVTRGKHFEKNAKTSKTYANEIIISPVNFEDAGKYECPLLKKGISVVINLVTIQVKASPSTKVFRGTNVSLTCSVSHVLHKQIELTWVQINNNVPVPMKTELLTNAMKQNTLFIKNINQEDSKWTCLVFHEKLLVDLASITLKYTEPPNENSTSGLAITIGTKPRTDISTYTSNITELREEEADHQISQWAVRVTCVVLFIIFVVPGLIYIQKTLGKPGSLNTSIKISEEIQDDVNYMSVKFNNQGSRERMFRSQHSANVLEDVIYAAIKEG